MKTLSTRCLASAGLASLLLLGCGDDGGGGTGADAGPGTDAPASTCPDHPNVRAMGAVCAIRGPDTAPITTSLRLTADNDYLLDGPVWIGNDTAETVLTIDAGVTIYGGDGSFLLIQRGSKIEATGTAAAPIVMTSAQPVGMRGAEDWGGLIINGRAPVNFGDTAGEAEGEAGTGTYGGNNPADDSGTLRYVRVEFAGNKVDTENELNGLALQGVGNGTTIEYVQIHVAADDGIEFYGGTVNVKYLVVTGSDDDSIDWVGGWSGKIQFAIAEQLPQSGVEAERGIEADNYELNHSATPFSSPVLSNVTLIARAGNPADGILLRRGTRGQIHNSIVTGFGGYCIEVDDAQTLTNVGDGSLVVSRLVLDCAMGGSDSMPLVVNTNTVVAAPLLQNWVPQVGSPAIGIGAGPTDPWFDAVTFAGGIGTENWTTGWTTLAPN